MTASDRKAIATAAGRPARKRTTAYGYDVIIVQVLTVLLMLVFYRIPSWEEIIRLDPVVDQ